MRRTVFRTFAPLAAALTLAMPMAAVAVEQDAPLATHWSREVWQAALRGDVAELEDRLQALPAVDDPAAAHVDRLAEAIELYQRNQQEAETQRLADRSEARDELRAQLDSGNLVEALRAAVKVQTLSEDFGAALDDPEVASATDLAERELAKAQTEQDWLYLQQLLFMLRTLYDDTDHFDEYDHYDEQLDLVSRRVSLLARYAPRRLHALQVKAAERDGEDPPPFNDSAADDWRERVEDVNANMLKAALRVAAEEHIEARHWRPLLLGGLEALRLFATTTDLSESFPALADEALVDQWVDQLEQQSVRLKAMDEREFNRWALRELLSDLVRLNASTLDLPESVLYHEFGDGAMYELDEFSEIIWPDKIRRFKQATQGNFIGVGILIKHNEKREVVVVNPLEGAPAYYAGIQPDDVIVEVDGESTVGWSLNDAVDRITGPRGEPVKLAVRRDDEVVNITIVRDEIKLRSVMGWWKEGLTENGDPMWNWYIDPVSRIAYVRLTQFTEDTYSDLKQAWEEVTAEGTPNGLILDLRFNPGGLLNAAVDISNLFVRHGVIVSGEDKHGHKAWADQRATPDKALFFDRERNQVVPTVVLINQGSASASEIVAGCLQAYGAAVVVGERSYGKGSVQTVHPIHAEAALKLTTQYYRLPPNVKAGETRGRLVHKRPGATEWGVDPDIKVVMTPNQLEQSLELRREADIISQDNGEDGQAEGRPDVNRLLTEGLDPQLEQALLILQANALASTIKNGDLPRAAMQ